MQVLLRKNARKWTFAVSLLMLGASGVAASCIAPERKAVQSPVSQSSDLLAIRYNQLGYKPNAKKSFVVLSGRSLDGMAWEIDGPAKLSGTLAQPISGPSIHTAQRYNYRIDVARDVLAVPGQYSLSVAGQRIEFRVAKDPYGPLFNEALRHVTVERSGEINTVLPPRTGNSHVHDRALPIYVSDGDLTTGNWKPRNARAESDTLDVLGGHYDAGDYITFTLIEAYTTYFMILANELRSTPELAREIDYSLRYLDKLLVKDTKHPDQTLFVVQKGNESDHGHWPGRLPEADSPTSPAGIVRPVMVAKSKCQMGITAAALARAHRSVDAKRGFLAKAKQVYEEAKASPHTTCSFESAKTNDFYRDDDYRDQMKLAAAELFLATRDESFLEDATGTFAVGAAAGLTWSSLNALANLALWDHDEASQKAAIAEVDGYVTSATHADNLWRGPSGYVWGTLNSWMAQAVAAGLRHQKDKHEPSRELMEDVLAYALGKNNWGLSFVYSNNPLYARTARELHDQIYSLSGHFPSGVFSEGPTSLSTHCSQESAGSTCGPGTGWVPLLSDPRCRSGADDDYDLVPWNSTQSEGAVYCDSREDYTTSEPVTYAQAVGMLLTALVDRNGG